MGGGVKGRIINFGILTGGFYVIGKHAWGLCGVDKFYFKEGKPKWNKFTKNKRF